MNYGVSIVFCSIIVFGFLVLPFCSRSISRVRHDLELTQEQVFEAFPLYIPPVDMRVTSEEPYDNSSIELADIDFTDNRTEAEIIDFLEKT